MVYFKLSWIPYILIVVGVIGAFDGSPSALILSAIGGIWLYTKHAYENASRNNPGGNTSGNNPGGNASGNNPGGNASGNNSGGNTSGNNPRENTKEGGGSIKPKGERVCPYCGEKVESQEGCYCEHCGNRIA